MIKKRKNRGNLDPTKIKIPVHRPEAAILADLESVCCSPGFAHTLAYLCWRENFFGFDEKLTPEDLSHFSSEERLLRSELSLLTRLMVSAPLDLSLPAPDATQKQINDVERLLHELHHSLNAPQFEQIKALALGKGTSETALETTGKTLREPMFYSAEAAYHFQYRDFAVRRYEADRDWLFSNQGYFPEDVPVFYDAISDIQTKKLSQLRGKITPENLENIDELSLLSVFQFNAEEIAENCGASVEYMRGVINAFSLVSHPIQPKYTEIGSWNQVSSYPIIPLDNDSFLLFQPYCLAESSYETPFFWMLQDEQYVKVATDHRGKFPEILSTARLASVFGNENVHPNVLVFDQSGETVDEFDVLVIYADRAIVLQAKSKKLNEESRKGSQESIKRDLTLAVQEAYDQGFSCAERLLAKEFQFKDENGDTLAITKKFSEIFLLCVVAEYFPGLPLYADKFVSLKQHDAISPPYVIDIFYLDVLCELLNNPLYFLSFLNRRSKYSEKVRSSSEMDVLGFHLSRNLWFDEGMDYVHLAEGFSANVDAAMLGRRDGLPSDHIPKGILTHHKDTHFGSLIHQISHMQESRVLDLGFLLLEASSETAQQISTAIETIFSRAKATGTVHDFSIALDNSGMTVHCGFQNDKKTYDHLLAHCEIKKYQLKAASWFGLALSAANIGVIRLTMGLHNEWKHDPRMDEAVRQFGSKPIKNLNKANWNQRKQTKIGVNQPCPCGSGKKYKKCCRANHPQA